MAVVGTAVQANRLLLDPGQRQPYPRRARLADQPGDLRDPVGEREDAQRLRRLSSATSSSSVNRENAATDPDTSQSTTISGLGGRPAR